MGVHSDHRSLRNAALRGLACVGGRAARAMLAGLVCAGVLAGLVSPAWAAEPPDGGGLPVGGFAVGDGVEAMVDERSGGLSFAVTAGGIGLAWDSRRIEADRYGFGFGWSVAGAGFVDVQGGVRVAPASGGVFAASSSVPSGLAGYELGDLRFEQQPGVVPARADGLVGERPYAFRLVELGGTRSYFDAAGDPVTSVDAFGNRMDWVWADEGSRRLTRTVSDLGVVAELDWSDPARVRVTTRAGAGEVAAASVMELDGGRVTGVVDPTGARASVGYTPDGLVARVAGASGAVTDVVWQRLADASVAVQRVRVVDGLSGAALSERSWAPAEGLASGWPTSPGPVPGGGDAGVRHRGLRRGHPDRIDVLGPREPGLPEGRRRRRLG